MELCPDCLALIYPGEKKCLKCKVRDKIAEIIKKHGLPPREMKPVERPPAGYALAW